MAALRHPGRFAAPAAAATLLAACSLAHGGKGAIDSDKLDAALDSRIGGDTTCVTLRDVKSGAVVYQYGNKGVCPAQLPPCGVFKVPEALIGLDAGVITPQTVYKWDRSPQPVSAWQTDAALPRAFTDSIQWWWGDLGQAIGHDRFAGALRRFGYGNALADGPERQFWLGAQNGGALTISNAQQTAFLQRLYSGGLGLKPASAEAVEGLMVDEVREDAGKARSTFSAVDGECAVAADGSRSVTWVVGRLQTPTRDLAYAATLVSPAPPPGIEVRQKLKDGFAEAGLWPAG